MGADTKSLILLALFQPCTSSKKMMIAMASVVSVARSNHHPRKLPMCACSVTRPSRVSMKARPHEIYRRIDVIETQSRRSSVPF